MEFCLVINVTLGGNQAVTWPSIIATRYVSFATTLLILGTKYLLSAEKVYFLHWVYCRFNSISSMEG